jgi:transposase-like protein
MMKYCIQDVRMTDRLYKKVRPFITNHPQLRNGDECPACTSSKTQKRGPRYTRWFRIQRNQCQSCAHWFETTRTKIKVNASG